MTSASANMHPMPGKSAESVETKSECTCRLVRHFYSAVWSVEVLEMKTGVESTLDENTSSPSSHYKYVGFSLSVRNPYCHHQPLFTLDLLLNFDSLLNLSRRVVLPISRFIT